MARAAKSMPLPAETDFWDRPVLIDLVADVLFLFALAGLCLAAYVALQRLPILPFREVVVRGGVSHITRPEIEAAAKAALNGNFFTVDLDEARTTFEKIAWLRRATLRRQWPDTLELTVEEHVPFGHWRQTDGVPRLMNTQGEVFNATIEADLPTFSGPEGSSAAVLERYRQFSEMLAKVSRKPVAMSVSNREAWQITLDDGLRLDLGRDEAKNTLEDRLSRFITYYPLALKKLQIASVAMVDLRYQNGFALRIARKS